MLAAYLFICTFLAYGIKGITGFGNTLVMNGLFSLCIENRLTSPADLIISLPTNLWMAWRERRHLRMRVALPLSLKFLEMTTATAVASRFRAVPPMVWSAFRLMDAKASSKL